MLISLGKMNIITGFLNQVPQKDVTLSITQTPDRPSVTAVTQLLYATEIPPAFESEREQASHERIFRFLTMRMEVRSITGHVGNRDA